jgi:hypothetical protein
MTRKSTDTVQLKLRFDEKLRRRIESAAKHNDHSMNAEIVDRLKKSFERDDMKKMITEVIGRLVKHPPSA